MKSFGSMTLDIVLMELKILKREKEVVDSAINGDLNPAMPYLYHGAIIAINSLMQSCDSDSPEAAFEAFESEISKISMGVEMVMSGMSAEDATDVIKGIEEGRRES